MKQSFLFFLFATGLIAIASCATFSTSSSYSSVQVTPIFKMEDLGARALEIENDMIYFAGKQGWVGSYNIKNKNLQTRQLDSTLEFRSLAVNKGKILLMNVLSPAYLYQGNSVKNLEKRIFDSHPDAFYNAMHIGENGLGALLGDATEGCLNIHITKDYGETWQRVDCRELGEVIPGEAAFAASDTNIEITDNETILIATGGIASRILKTTSGAKIWQIIQTPIVQGTATTGIYSMDFYDDRTGIAIGGDYTHPESNAKNLIKTTNGGLDWEIISDSTRPNYRSCIQFFPESNAQNVVTVGHQGIDISNDGGTTWHHISDQSLFTLRFLNQKTAFAAGKNGVYRLDFN